MKRSIGKFIFISLIAIVAMVGFASSLSAAKSKPNILVIWGDDIGQSNISAYTRGLVGYKTPNIDRIAKEGILFTDYYGEQSCTAGRASFMMGQSVFRTGLSKVGLPGAKEGSNVLDPTIAVLLKDQGYVTGQFGKNHFGDRDEHLPTNHGFDEFFGNLYHLNAEEEPENEDYPGDMVLADGQTFRQKFGPRGVIHSWAKADGTRMHFRTHVKKELRGISGQDEYADGMVEHDMHIGKFLKLLDDLGIADNTIIHYSTDNGPHYNTWPDAAATPFRGEKNTNWEGGWRVPCAVRWPGVIKPGSVSNGVVHHMDWMPTFLAAAGKTDLKEDLLDGYTSKALGRKYKIHLDGYDLTGHLKNPDNVASPRKEIFYFSDDGDLTALRYQDWKLIFMEQKATGTFRVWMEPFVPLRVPLILNLRRDPYERAEVTSNTYFDWMLDRAFLLVPAQAYVGNFLSSFKEYPPRMKAASFSLDQVMEKMMNPSGTQ